MEIASGCRDCKAACTVCGLMDMTCIVAARNVALDLSGNAVFLGDLHCAVNKIAVVDGGAVHKGNNSSVTNLADSRVLGNVGKVCDSGGFKNDCIIGAEAVRRCGCTRNSDFTIDYYNKVHAKGVTFVGAHTMARPQYESSEGWWTEVDDIKTYFGLLEGKRLVMSDLNPEVHSPAEAPEVYNRLINEKNFPTVQFDWRLLDE